VVVEVVAHEVSVEILTYYLVVVHLLHFMVVMEVLVLDQRLIQVQVLEHQDHVDL
jgi:hypothetical protein